MIEIPIPGLKQPLAFMGEVIETPYTHEGGDAFRDFMLEGARKQLELMGGVSAVFGFLMPVFDAPLCQRYGTGILPIQEYMEDHDTKNRIASLLRGILQLFKGFYCVFISEVWSAQIAADKTVDEIRQGFDSVEDMPNVQEHLMVVVEKLDANGLPEATRWLFPIHRDAEGKPSLGPRIDLDQGSMGAEGRFASFLPPAPGVEVH